MNEATNPKLFKVVVIEQITDRVWYEVPGVTSVEEAIAAYKAGQASETYRKHRETDLIEIEDVYEEE